MSKTRSAQLDTTWIRYRIPMLLYLRLKFYARRQGVSMTLACRSALESGLDEHQVPSDPATLLGVEE